MMIKKIDIDDFGMIYLSCLRHCLTKKEDKNVEMLFSLMKKFRGVFTRRDFSCSLEDLVNAHRYGNFDYDYLKENEKDDSIVTSFSNYVLACILNHDMQSEKIREISITSIGNVFSDLNYFVFHDITKVESLPYIEKLFANANFQKALEDSRCEFNVDKGNEFVDLDFTEEELDFLCKNSIHYGVGRRTYVTSIIPAFVLHVKDFITVETKDYIKNYILEKKEKDDNSNDEYKVLGDSCDRASWLALVEKL